MNAFSSYAAKARSIVERPAPLVGKHKTRAEAKQAYVAIVEELRAIRDLSRMQGFLASIEADLVQFHAELDFLWEGDGEDFLGLDREIESAFETVEAAQFFSRPHQVRNQFRSPAPEDGGRRFAALQQ